MMDDGAQLRNRINKQVYNAMHGRKRMKLNAKLLHCLAHKHTAMSCKSQHSTGCEAIGFFNRFFNFFNYFFNYLFLKKFTVCAFFQFLDIFLSSYYNFFDL